jgi:cobalt/nickel transport system permease protein
MSHLHIPDGILPPALWIAGLVLTALVLAWSGPAAARGGPRLIAYQSALGGIMLAVMALPVPITAFDYCMTLAGPVGVLLGPASVFQVSFVVTLILALLGQGGFTVVGLNTLVLGLGAMLARPIYLKSVRALRPGRAVALATAVSQLASTLAWILVLLLSVRLTPDIIGEHEISAALVRGVHGVGAVIVLAMLLAAVAIEALLGYGLASFLDRVRPDLLPVPNATRGGASGGPSLHEPHPSRRA